MSDSQAKEAFKMLNDNAHLFDKDIDPSHIVGGKGYKKRTLKQVGKYIKNNPGRFGKEAGKVIVGAGAATYGVSKMAKKRREIRNDNTKTKTVLHSTSPRQIREG